MRKVIVSYSPVKGRVGKEIELEDDEAAQMVREGRARYVEDGDGKAAAKATAKAGSVTKTGPAATGTA